VADHALRAGRHRLRHELREGLEQRLDQAHNQFPTADDRGRVGGVDDCALRCVDRDDLVEPLVHRHIRIDQALECVGAGGKGLRDGGVDWRAALHVTASEVEVHALVVNRDAGVHADRLIGETVVVEESLCLAHTLRQARDLGPGPSLSVGNQLVDIGDNLFGAETVQQLAEPLDAGVVRGDLCAEVARGLAFGPDLRHDQREDVLDDLAALDQLDWRNLNTFLVDFLECADRRRGTAADVDVMDEVGDESIEHAAVINRRDQRDVIQVTAAAERIVDQDAVAGTEPVDPIGAHVSGDERREQTQVCRLAERLGNDPEIAIE
jgi:hypothetical protein